MADKVWVSTNGNVNDAASWSPSGVPAANDSIYFDESSQQDAVSGLTALSGFDLTRVWIKEGYEGNIGADGNPFTVKPGRLIHEGSGSLYLSQADHASISPNVVVDSPNLIDAFTLTAAGSDLRLHVLSGAAKILDNVGAFTVLTVSQKRISTSLEIGSGTGEISYYYQNGGTVTTKRGLGPASGTVDGTCVMDGGRLVIADDFNLSSTWFLLNLAGGVVEHNAIVSSGAMPQNIFVSSGLLDMTKDYRAKTISLLVLMPASQFATHPNITTDVLVDLRTTPPILP